MFRIIIVALITGGCHSVPAETKSGDTAGHSLDSAAEDTASECPYTIFLSDASPYGPICSGDLTQTSELVPGDLFQSEGSSVGTWYYANAGRFVVPHGTVFESWWGADACICAQVKLVPESVAANVALIGDVTVKPGKFILQPPNDPTIFLIDAPRTIRRVSEEVAAEIYGANWTNLVREIPEVFFVDYTVGPDVVNAAEYDLTVATATTIEDVLAGY